MANVALARKAKMGVCTCGAAIWYGVDADAAGIPVTLDRAALDPAGCAAAWPDLYVIRLERIYEVGAPRYIWPWETAHRLHTCQGGNDG